MHRFTETEKPLDPTGKTTYLDQCKRDGKRLSSVDRTCHRIRFEVLFSFKYIWNVLCQTVCKILVNTRNMFCSCIDYRISFKIGGKVMVYVGLSS